MPAEGNLPKYIGVARSSTGSQFLETDVSQVNYLTQSPESICLVVAVDDSAVQPGLEQNHIDDARRFMAMIGIDEELNEPIATVITQNRPYAHVRALYGIRMIYVTIQFHAGADPDVVDDAKELCAIENVVAALSRAFRDDLQPIVSEAIESGFKILTELSHMRSARDGISTATAAKHALAAASLRDLLDASEVLIQRRFDLLEQFWCCTRVLGPSTKVLIREHLSESATLIELLQAKMQYIQIRNGEAEAKSRSEHRAAVVAAEQQRLSAETERDRKLARYGTALVIPSLWIGYWATRAAPEVSNPTGSIIVIVGVMILIVVGLKVGAHISEGRSNV